MTTATDAVLSAQTGHPRGALAALRGELLQHAHVGPLLERLASRA